MRQRLKARRAGYCLASSRSGMSIPGRTHAMSSVLSGPAGNRAGERFPSSAFKGHASRLSAGCPPAIRVGSVAHGGRLVRGRTVPGNPKARYAPAGRGGRHGPPPCSGTGPPCRRFRQPARRSIRRRREHRGIPVGTACLCGLRAWRFSPFDGLPNQGEACRTPLFPAGASPRRDGCRPRRGMACRQWN